MTIPTNTLWCMTQTYNTIYARCGTHSHARRIKEPDCSGCGYGATYEMPPKPLSLIWEPDSDLVGDFSWAPGGRAAVTRAVFDALAQEFSGIAAEPIVMLQDEKLKRPVRPTKRTKRRVWLPYEGPPLVELWIERMMVPLLPTTTLEVWYHCDDCGRPKRRLGGGESLHSRWNPQTMDLDRVHTPRVPGQGVFVRRAALGGVQLFRVEEFYRMILCTDEVKTFIEERGFTNVSFLEYGNVVD